MKKEDLFQAMNDIDENSIIEASSYKAMPKVVLARRIVLGICVLVLAIGILPMLKKGNANYTSGVLEVQAQYPEATSPNMSPEAFVSGDAHWQWWQAYQETVDASSGLQEGMEAFNTALMTHLLTSEDENTVCSPINVYLAYSMLAEIAGNNSRKQILNALGAKNIETLRTNATKLWQANYVDTPVLKSLLANSLWLNGKLHYNADTLELLAKSYYASTFCGEPGSQEMDQSLQQWINENTNDLLKEYVEDLHLDPRTIIAIVSTIYYKAMWTTNFNEQATDDSVFHGTKGDTTVKMMHSDEMTSVYHGDHFISLEKPLSDSGNMYFFLPKEETDVNALINDPEVYEAMKDSSEEKRTFPIVHLSVPRFKVSAKMDLLETMKELGMNDILDPSKANFKPLIQESEEIFLSSAEHAAMVEINEQGVTGAAFTDLMVTGAGMPQEEIDFVLDRPFFFMVTGRDGSILFSGVVRNIA